MTYCDFGENLKKLRKAHNLTQKEFGLKFGLSKAVVSKYENGLAYPSYDMLIRISHYFGVTTDFLLGVAETNLMDVSGLTGSQVNCIYQLVLEYRKANDT